MVATSTILVIDDEPNLRNTLTKILQNEGYSVTGAEDAGQALQYLQAGAYDLTFLDLAMPGMDGVTLLGEIRKYYPDMPVLILTANATLESAIEAVRQGARDYLIKPVDPPRILARVKDILSEQQQPRRQREIMGQIQNLVYELQSLGEGDRLTPDILHVLPPTDPARFLQRGPFTIDLHARHVTFNDEFIPLSPSNFDYFVTLVRHSPNPISYEHMVRESQGYELSRIEAQEMARWRIHELRKALEPDPKQPRFIITVRGQGYRLVT
jgi:two-component system phosphate regulon response regulator OmpR